MKKLTFCLGCGHIPIAKIVEKILQETQGIFVGSVGCSVSLVSDMDNVNAVSSAHGRALAVATGIRRIIGNEKPIITIQGDGDLLNIGIGEFIHTVARNEKIICILVNNSIFGMTGFQLASTTPIGIKTKTSPLGRDEKIHGVPLLPHKLLNAINPNAQYHLTTVTNKEEIIILEKTIRGSLLFEGFTLIEVMSPCTTFFGDIKKSYEYIERRKKQLNNEIKCFI